MKSLALTAEFRIKEVYRNHYAHGSFSREMMAYVEIPNFGRFPMFIGKKLKGFVDEYDNKLTIEKYLKIKKVFSEFWGKLDVVCEIPMLFIRSGLPIPIDTNYYTEGVSTKEEALCVIDLISREMDNEDNMDW